MLQRLLKLLDYAGDYDHPGYGGITITLAEGNLHWAYRGMSEPLGLGTTIGLICPRQPAACCMTGSPPIGKETLRVWPLRSSPSFKDVVFTRATAGGRTNPAFRQHCTRTFSRGGTIVVVGRDMQCWWLGERRVRRLAEARMFGIGTYPAVRVIGELFRSRGKSCSISAAP